MNSGRANYYVGWFRGQKSKAGSVSGFAHGRMDSLPIMLEVGVIVTIVRSMTDADPQRETDESGSSYLFVVRYLGGGRSNAM